MEDCRLGLKTVVNPAAADPADVGRQINQHRERGDQTTGRLPVELAHLVDPEVTPGALICDRGVNIAIGDDHLPAPQRGQDQGLDMVGPVRGEEQGLCPRGHVFTVQHELANGTAEDSTAGLPRHDHCVTELLEPRTQQPGLG